MEIRGFIENSLLEWEGKIACVVFVPRCNLRCKYCHAAHLLGATKLENIEQEQILSYMRQHAGWVDGAVITGGEPTLRKGELVDFCEKVQDAGLEVMLETNGTQPYWIKRLLTEGSIQAITMDVKAPLRKEEYSRVTDRNVEVDDLKRSMELIMEADIPYEFRITVVPDLVGEDELRRMAPDLEGAEKVALQNFQPNNCLDSTLQEVFPYTPEQMDHLASQLQGVDEVVVRGRERGITVRSDRQAG